MTCLGRTRYAVLAGAVVALGVLATVLGITTTDEGISVPAVWLPFSLVSALLFLLVPRYVAWQAWRTNPLVRLRERVRVDSTGVTSTSELATTRLAWAAIKVAYETDRFFALASKKGSGAVVLVVPKDDLRHDELVTARALILENVGSIR